MRGQSTLLKAFMHSNDEILERIRTTLVQQFELDRARITPEARLLDDLEIDSIDVVDLMEEIRRFTGKKVTAEDFRSVRTVADLAGVIVRLEQG
jgi:acyl carrier protein